MATKTTAAVVDGRIAEKLAEARLAGPYGLPRLSLEGDVAEVIYTDPVDDTGRVVRVRNWEDGESVVIEEWTEGEPEPKSISLRRSAAHAISAAIALLHV